jgi:hypothetical protein
MNETLSLVLSCWVSMQTNPAYYQYFNTYCTNQQLYQAYQQFNSNNNTVSLRGFTMCLNNIVNLGYITSSKLELFKRKKWLEKKSYINEFFIKSTLRCSPRNSNTTSSTLASAPHDVTEVSVVDVHTNSQLRSSTATDNTRLQQNSSR